VARLEGLKKPDMAAAAEELLRETSWLPTVMRTTDRNLPAEESSSHCDDAPNADDKSGMPAGCDDLPAAIAAE
jgi:hypothetical protein